jgi:hypothetical protein
MTMCDDERPNEPSEAPAGGRRGWETPRSIRQVTGHFAPGDEVWAFQFLCPIDPQRALDRGQGMALTVEEVGASPRLPGRWVSCTVNHPTDVAYLGEDSLYLWEADLFHHHEACGECGVDRAVALSHDATKAAAMDADPTCEAEPIEIGHLKLWRSHMLCRDDHQAIRQVPLAELRVGLADDGKGQL